MVISKYKLKNFLAETVAANLLQTSEDKLFHLIRYDGIKGFEKYSDGELFVFLTETIPEFEFAECEKIDNNNFYLAVKKEHNNNAEDLKVDITRIIQMKMLA